MKWKVKALYLYRNNKHYTVSQLYEEVFKAIGVDKLFIYESGNKCWYLNGKLHRENGPAIELTNGYKEWWINDKLHRKDGPAVEDANSSKEWYINGKRHREDGPAVEWAYGHKEWWLNGENLTEEEFIKRTK